MRQEISRGKIQKLRHMCVALVLVSGRRRAGQSCHPAERRAFRMMLVTVKCLRWTLSACELERHPRTEIAILCHAHEGSEAARARRTLQILIRMLHSSLGQLLLMVQSRWLLESVILREVTSEENWMRAYLRKNSAVSHWNCYMALL